MRINLWNLNNFYYLCKTMKKFFKLFRTHGHYLWLVLALMYLSSGNNDMSITMLALFIVDIPLPSENFEES